MNSDTKTGFRSDEEIDKAIDAVTANKPGPKCSVCSDDNLRRAVDRWVERKGDQGEEHLPTLGAMFKGLFSKMAPLSKLTIRRHIMVCLKRDPSTLRRV